MFAVISGDSACALGLDDMELRELSFYTWRFRITCPEGLTASSESV